MASTDVLTLGPEGRLSDINLKIDYLMCCFFFSKASQTVLFIDKISSLPKVIQAAGSDEIRVAQDMTDALQAFLSRNFEEVSVDIRVDQSVYPGISLQMNLMVSDTGSVRTGGTSVGYSLMINDSKLKSLLNITTNKSLIAA